ncbi:hypothetical protein KO489_04970 [Reinekea forsetii]|nr:hypothetical protein [Reinekea forsetii]
MKLNAKSSVSLTNSLTYRWIAVAIFVFVLLTATAIWFQRTYVGWLIESVPEPNSYLHSWQTTIDRNETIQHPAVIHLLPDHCLCTLLTMGHATNISRMAEQNGFNIVQVGTHHKGLGKSVELESPKLSPTIAITDANGQIKYLGAYSEGVRCTNANSMVDTFLEGVSHLPSATIVGLDVKVCRCQLNP